MSFFRNLPKRLSFNVLRFLLTVLHVSNRYLQKVQWRRLCFYNRSVEGASCKNIGAKSSDLFTAERGFIEHLMYTVDRTFWKSNFTIDNLFSLPQKICSAVQHCVGRILESRYTIGFKSFRGCTSKQILPPLFF